MAKHTQCAVSSTHKANTAPVASRRQSSTHNSRYAHKQHPLSLPSPRMENAGLEPREACGTRSTMGSCWCEEPPVATCKTAGNPSKWMISRQTLRTELRQWHWRAAKPPSLA